MGRRLPARWFNRATLKVAEDLLGCWLVRRVGQRLMRGRIIETEAYDGFRDRASHASKGLTPRTALMFGPPGRAYVYLVYGMHHCLNVVTREAGYPAAVLIRAVELPDGTLLNGPGRVCRYFRITRGLNREALTSSKRLWIEQGSRRPGERTQRGTRIGVGYAGQWACKKWRFGLVTSYS